MPSTLPQQSGWRTLHLLVVIITAALVISACSIPFVGDDDPEADMVTPVPTGVTDLSNSDDSDEPDEPETETRDDNWTVLTAPARRPAPETRDERQVLRLNGTAEGPTTLDPALVRDTTSAFIVRQVFRGLVRLNEDLDVVPDLAQTIEISPDGRQYRFTLHEDLTFHDGTPITADAVKRSIERAADPSLLIGDSVTLPAHNYIGDIEGALERMRGERDNISGIRVIDDRTLEMDLVRGVVDFLERLANPIVAVVDADSATIGTEWWRSPNGSGPFRIAEWDPDRVLRLAPHDGYVYPAYLNEVTMRMGRDAVNELRLYETGEIDVAAVAVSAIDRIVYPGSPFDGHLRSIPLYSSSFALINREIEPFADEHLRQALAAGFPREKIAEVMLDGRAEVAEGILPPGMNGSQDIQYPFQHDVERAMNLLELADRSDDAIIIYTSGGAIPAAMKQVYEEDLNLDVEVVLLRWSDYLQDLDDRNLAFFVLSWVADGPDAASFLKALFHSDSPDNYIDFSDPEVDRLLDDAAVERDEEARSRMIQEAQEIILDAAVVIPLFHGVDYLLVRDEVRGLQASPMGILGLESVRLGD